MQSVLLASESSIKYNVVAELFPSDKYTITCVNCDECKLPSQPVNCTEQCAKLRLNYIRSIKFPDVFDYYIAIENGIEIDTEDEDDIPRDVCVVLIEHKGLLGYSDTDMGFSIPIKYYKRLSGFTQDSRLNVQGYNLTIGDLMHNDNPSIDRKNWVKTHHGICRSEQIKSRLTAALINLDNSRNTAQKILSTYKSYSEFPPGSTENNTVQPLSATLSQEKELMLLPDFDRSEDPFEIEQCVDFFSIIREYEDIERLLFLIADQYRFDTIDYIVGPESKGFFGFGLSCVLKVGFIPLRKKGKLPGKVTSLTYQTGSTSDSIEAPTDIKSGSRVVIFDDLIASGSSLRAARDILESLGCIIIDCVVLRQMIPLQTVAKDKMGIPYKVLLQE